MWPAQFRTQCVSNWICAVELAHFSQIWLVKSFPKFRCQMCGQVLQQLFAISCTVIFSAGFVDLLTDFPIGRHHCGVYCHTQTALCRHNGMADWMIGLLCCIVRLKLVIHSVHLAPAIILSEVLGIPPTHPAKSFITNSAIGLWQILPKHTKSIFFIALALLRYFFQYSRKSPVRREALKCILLRMVPVATQYTKKIL